MYETCSEFSEKVQNDLAADATLVNLKGLGTYYFTSGTQIASALENKTEVNACARRR